jgi:hypothetical protein
MKRLTFLLLLLCMRTVSFATDNPADVLLSLVGMKPSEATEEQVTTILGKPDHTEESKKQSVWYYTLNNNSLVVYWDQDARLQKYSFSTLSDKKGAWDNGIAKSLKMGETDLSQAIKALGIPKEMMVKESNQELHYAYDHNILNLFFRKGTLVNYSLY